MGSDEERTTKALKGRRILIIEDDKDLTLRLKELFESCGVRSVSVKRCVRGARQGGLDILLKRGDDFDLICVDIMLPWSERDLKECQVLQREWNQLLKEVAKLREKRASGDDLAEQRDRLNKLSQEIRARIDREAGIKMIQHWRQEMSKKAGGQWSPKAAILILTAHLKDESLAAGLAEFTRRTRWITKPAFQWQVLTAAAELLDDATQARGGNECH